MLCFPDVDAVVSGQQQVTVKGEHMKPSYDPAPGDLVRPG